MNSYDGITLILGPTGSGKTWLLKKICLEKFIPQKLIIETDCRWKPSDQLLKCLLNSKYIDIPVFITGQTDVDIPIDVRKNAQRIIFASSYTMRCYFQRISNELRYVTKMEEYQKMLEILNDMPHVRIIWFSKENRFEIMHTTAEI